VSFVTEFITMAAGSTTDVTVQGAERWAVRGAALMAATWFASGVVALSVPGGDGPGMPGELRFYLIESLHGAGEIGMLAALLGIHRLQSSVYGRLGVFGFRAAFVGTAALALATAMWLAFVAVGSESWYVEEGMAPGNFLTFLAFALGMVGWLVGIPLLGIATVRAEILPRWFGWLLITFVPMIVALGLVLLAYATTGILVGLLWLLLAHGLRNALNDEKAQLLGV
jgi:hypothetical protein